MTLRDGQRQPDKQEQEILQQFAGWGAFGDVFNNSDQRYAEVRQELQELLTDDEYRRARETILTAFYTPPEIVSAMWDGLRTAGLDGGRVLEPGCGTGDFIAQAPADTAMVGVELDNLSALIASHLHPDAQIRRESFVDTNFEDGYFAATIGNVPFAQFAPYDPDRNRTEQKLHNYFISKSVDLTQDGGYIAVITSKFTADAQEKMGVYGPRDAITERADFITGIRLPGNGNGAFADHAGTEVTADVLIFRKREQGQEPTERTEQFKRTTMVTVDGEDFRVNEFFATNPDHVLGEQRVTSGRWGRELSTEGTHKSAAELGDALKQIIAADISAAVADGYGQLAPVRVPGVKSTYGLDDDIRAGLLEQASSEMKEIVGTIRYERDGKDYTFEQYLPSEAGGMSWQIVKPRKKALQKDWADLIDLSVTTRALLQACTDEDTKAIAALRVTLTEQYDAYVDEHGYINRHTFAAPKVPTQAQIDKRFAKAETAWRKDNPVNDRPFEGELPEDVREQLLEEVSEVTYDLTPQRPHLAGAISTDPFINAVTALEHYNEETGKAKKSALFTTNPLRSVPDISQAETIEDALVVVGNSPLPLTVENIADLLDGKTARDVEAELVDNGIAFRSHDDPEVWEPAHVYLSGAVRTKLREARALAQEHDWYQPNVKALESKQPERITEGISMNLGATWIPEDIYKEFITETLELPPRIANTLSLKHSADRWFVLMDNDDYFERDEVDLKWGVRAANAPENGSFNFQSKQRNLQGLRHHGIANKRGHTPTVFSGLDVITAAMNITPPKLNYSRQAEEELGLRGVHPEATRFAGRKTEEMSAHFKKWTTANPERYGRLLDAYNDAFNNVVPPEYDGSRRVFPGLSEGFTPYKYQRDAVERIVNEPSVLLNHVVGAGKTGTMIMGAMELKRLGKINQPWLVVPNHLVEQIAREANQWYPAANVLSGAAARDKKARQMFLAQTSMNDWDLVVVPESVFTAVGVSAEVEARYLDQALSEIRQDLEEMQSAQQQSGKRSKSHNQKELEGIMKSLEEKYLKAVGRIGHDEGITFDMTGCDYLVVDEAHGYKNLGRYSPLGDLACTGSQKATDMDMKLSLLRWGKPDNTPIATFATGTPIANSIAELWVMQRYLRPDLLKESGIAGINSWGVNFTKQTTELDFTAGGKIKEKARISSYENVGDLAVMSTPFMDVVSRDEITAKLPELEDGKSTLVQFDVAQSSKDLIRDLLWREQEYTVAINRIDGPLKMVGDGRKATLDPRLANLEHDPAVGRVKAVSDTLHKVWEENRDNEYRTQDGSISPNRGALQIVFCDQGVPSKTQPDKFNVYDAVRDELVARGMERDRIRFIHEWEDNKLQLFDDCNNGKVDVLIGNTPKLGTGANIQSRAVALHHMDVPWRPADLEQREGRIVRQGNQNDNVNIFNYVAEGTYDGYSWNVVERKARFIEQFNSAERGMRSMEPLEDSGAEAMAHNKAIATGNPDFVTKIRLERELESLESAATEHNARVESNAEQLKHYRNDLTLVKGNIGRLDRVAPLTEAWVETEQVKPDDKHPPENPRTWEFGGREYTDRKQAAQSMVNALLEINELPDAQKRQAHPIGTIGGVEFRAMYNFSLGRFIIRDGTTARPTEVDIERIRPITWNDEQREAQIKDYPNILTSLENKVRGYSKERDLAHARIKSLEKNIASLESEEVGGFPEQEQLDQVRAEFAAVNERIRHFENSDEVKNAQLEYDRRMADKGYPPGWSLELNPTQYMLDEGIVCHPNTKPISHADPMDNLWAYGIDENISAERTTSAENQWSPEGSSLWNAPDQEGGVNT